MKEFINLITGIASVPQFAAALLFAYITAFAIMLFHTTTRDVLGDNKPIVFSWSFFLRDNSTRILSNIILIFLAVRFSQYWIGPEKLIYSGAVVGLISDKLGVLFEKLSNAVTKTAEKKIDKL